MGPKQPRSTVLTQEEAALIVAFKRTLLPLDDCAGTPVRGGRNCGLPTHRLYFIGPLFEKEMVCKAGIISS